VVQADGKYDLERNVNGGGPSDLFKFGVNTALSANSVPDDRWWSGASSGLDIFNISALKDTMSFQLRGVPVVGVAGRSPSPAPAGFAVAGRRANLFLDKGGLIRVTAASADGRVRVLAEGPMAAGARALDLGALPAGAYTLRAEGDGVRAAASAVLY
jgi:hypothetical protein